MNINVPGNTPMERLTEFIRRVIALPKSEVAEASKKPIRANRKRRR